MTTKIIDRIRKLLALAADGAATEHEAALAAERARSIMAEHGLSTAQIEASGGTGERRADDRLSGNAGEHWMWPLMSAICATCFVHVELMKVRDRAGRPLGAGYRLIGRESAVATATVLYEYLCQSVRRVAREAGDVGRSKYFRRGVSERLCERIKERHDAAMREQAASAREQQAAARHPSAAPGTALVVVLEDYAQAESDLNDDLRRGVAPGTTARERSERDGDRARRVALARKYVEELGVSDSVASYMAYGFSLEKAEAMCEEPEEKPETPAERRRREERDARYRERMYERFAKKAAERQRPEWHAGREAADDIGLDQQVKSEADRRIS